MLRFINLSDQINEGEKEFAFYDTVTESFVTLSGAQTWTSVDDFRKDAHDDPNWFYSIDRMLSLIPANWESMAHLIPTIFIDDDTIRIGHHQRTTKGNSEYRSISVPPMITQGSSLQPAIDRLKRQIQEHIARQINALTPDERIELFSNYCTHYGEPTPGNERCYCSVW
jgi:hypothetical protein